MLIRRYCLAISFTESSVFLRGIYQRKLKSWRRTTAVSCPTPYRFPIKMPRAYRASTCLAVSFSGSILMSFSATCLAVAASSFTMSQ